ncbi:MAG: aminoacyl-tRNA hydrolase [Candidatus Binataceae bacterium]
MSLRGLFGSFRRSEPKADAPAALSHIAWLIVGLGNPEDQYRRSRHNLGFMALDRLAERCGARLGERRFKAHFGRCEIDGQAVLLGEPQTYMNASGEAVAPLLNYFKIEPAHLIVIHDELDLDASRIRIKRGGGHAGNNGIRSIIESLGTGDFVRIRIGVGRPPQGRDAVGFVLQPMTRDELAAYDPVIESAAKAAEAIVASGVASAMNKYNQRA